MRAILTSLIVLAGLAVAQPAFADADGWLDERYEIVVRNQPLRDVLAEFGAMVGVPTSVSEAVENRVSARFEGATGREILDAVAREYALDWRFDGRRLEVTAHSEHITRILDLGGVSRGELVDALTALNAYNERFPVSVYDTSLAMVTAPPPYVAQVEIVLAELVERRLIEEARAQERRAALAERRAAEEERARAERDARAAEARQRETEARRIAFARELEAIRAQGLLEQSMIERAEREAERRRIEAEQRLQRELRGPVVVRGGVFGG